MAFPRTRKESRHHPTAQQLPPSSLSLPWNNYKGCSCDGSPGRSLSHSIGGKRSPAGLICSGTLAIHHEQDRWHGQRFLVAITIFFLNMRSGTK